MALLRFQMAPKPIFLISSGSRKKEPRYICLIIIWTMYGVKLADISETKKEEYLKVKFINFKLTVRSKMLENV